MLQALAIVCELLAVGGTAFYGLVVLACRRLARRPEPPIPDPPLRVSVLKPLAGLDLDLEAHLRTVFATRYPDFEILFGVRSLEDGAAPVARKLIDEHPHVDARLVVTGAPESAAEFPNPKVYNLMGLAQAATGELLVISDCDVRSGPDYLDRVTADFSDTRVGVSTCPYLAIGGGSLWSELEAIGANTEFWGGAFVAQMLAPMDFAVGPTMAVRRDCLDELGGFQAMRDSIAEDFLIGNQARTRGWEVVLSKHVVEHHIGSQDFATNWKHRLRWYRMTRGSRGWLYLSQVFTYPGPFAVLLVGLTGGAPWSWTLLAACAALRAAAAAAAARVVGQPTGLRFWTLLPVQDVMSLAAYVLGGFGSRITWRTHRFKVVSGGRLRPL